MICISKLKQITLVLENCDAVTFNGKYIADFEVSDIQKDISRLGCNSIEETTYCKMFFIEISKSAKDIKTAFCESGFNITAFNRLMEFNDITQLIFTIEQEHYEYEHEENFTEEEPKCTVTTTTKDYHFFVDWSDTDYMRENNDYQSSYLSKCGNLYICISKDHKVEDLINMEEVNDEEAMKFKFDFYDLEYK